MIMSHSWRPGVGYLPAILYISVGDGPDRRRRVAARLAACFLPKSEFCATALTELLG
jgi:hypothetical protein